MKEVCPSHTSSLVTRQEKKEKMKLTCFVPVLIVMISSIYVDGAVLGIDMGTQWIEAAVLKPGFFDVVDNEVNDRKTPTAVAFTRDGERVYGETALKQLPKTPTRVVVFASELLGRKVCFFLFLVCLSSQLLPPEGRRQDWQRTGDAVFDRGR